MLQNQVIAARFASGADCGQTVAIYADRGRLRAELAEDAAAVGLRVMAEAELAALVEVPDAGQLAEVVLVDCPEIDNAGLGALATLDRRAAKVGAQLIVSTTLDSLDAVYAAITRTTSDILVVPSRAERLVAIGRALARQSPARLRELSEEDRLTLVRLAEQVAQLADRLERLKSPASQAASVPFRVGGAPAGSPEAALVNSGGALPEPRLVRQIIRQRQLRGRFFDADLFADPAWDMLLDLTAARGEGVRVSVTSLCIASGVPPTTALRWISQLVDAGLFVRVEDVDDRRRAFITLSDSAAEAMARYFGALPAGTAPVS